MGKSESSVRELYVCQLQLLNDFMLQRYKKGMQIWDIGLSFIDYYDGILI